MDDLLQRLERLFRDVLDDPQLTLTEKSDAESIPGYDSITHINVISAVEQEFGVRFDLDDILDLENAGDLAALIDRKQRRAA